MRIIQEVYIWHEPIKGWGFHLWVPNPVADRCLVCNASGMDYRTGKIRIKKTKTKNPPQGEESK